MTPRYRPRLDPPKDWAPGDGQGDLNPWLLVLLVVGMSIASGVVGAWLGRLSS